MLTEYQKALAYFLLRAKLDSMEVLAIVQTYEKEDQRAKDEILVWIAHNNPTRQEVLHYLATH